MTAAVREELCERVIDLLGTTEQAMGALGEKIAAAYNAVVVTGVQAFPEVVRALSLTAPIIEGVSSVQSALELLGMAVDGRAEGGNPTAPVTCLRRLKNSLARILHGMEERSPVLVCDALAHELQPALDELARCIEQLHRIVAARR